MNAYDFDSPDPDLYADAAAEAAYVEAEAILARRLLAEESLDEDELDALIAQLED